MFMLIGRFEKRPPTTTYKLTIYKLLSFRISITHYVSHIFVCAHKKPRAEEQSGALVGFICRVSDYSVKRTTRFQLFTSKG